MTHRSGRRREAAGKLLGLLCLAGLALSACGGGGGEAATPTPGGPSGGTLTVGWGQTPDTLNPATTMTARAVGRSGT